jgi:hypothetical protein
MMTNEEKELAAQARKAFYEKQEAEVIPHPKSSSGEYAANYAEKLYKRFISYPSPHCLTAHVLWTFHTHVVDRFDTTPRLAFLSPEPASGKTRALELTERMVPNPVSAINVTPAYLFRKIGDEKGVTILFDEIDTVFGPKAKENEELRGLLNAGYRRGAKAGRCITVGKTVETQELPAFAPVALAGLNWLPDTIMSRAVIIRMQRRAAGEVIDSYRRRIHDGITDHGRGLIEMWARTFPAEVDSWPELSSLGIEDRNADIWEPLIVIADHIGGEWPAKAREAAVSLVSLSKEQKEPSLGIRLLVDLRSVFGDNEYMATAVILQALHDMEEAPWANLKGQPLNSRGLSVRLLQYGIKPRTVRPGDGGTAKGYASKDFHEAWNRYAPLSPEKSVTSVTSVTSLINFNETNDLDVSGASVTSVTGTKLSDTSVSGVSDRAVTANSAVTEKHKQNQYVKSIVSNVSDASAKSGYVGACAHCGEAGDTLEVYSGGEMVRLHRDCIDGWQS